MDIKGLSQVLNLDPLRLLEGQGALNAVLSRLSGTELEALLAGRTQEGLLLELLDGHTVVAGGDLPFPDGTQLLLRAVPGSEAGGLRLQLLQATPPPPSPILVPLEQGEANALLQRVLSAEALPEILAPLRTLLAQAAEVQAQAAPAAATPPSVETPGSLSSAPLPSVPTPAAPAPPAWVPPAAAPTPPPLAGLIPPTLPLLKAWVTEASPTPSTATPLPSTSLPAEPVPALPTALELTKELVARGVPPAQAEAWSAFLVEPEAPPPPLPAEFPLPARLEAPLPGAPSLPPSTPPVPTSAGPAPAPEWHQALSLLFSTAESTSPSATPRPLGPVLDELRRAQVPEPLLQRLLPLLALARPAPEGGAIEQLLRALLPQIAPPLPAKAEMPRPAAPTTASETPPSAARTVTPEAAAWEAPETWEGWLQHATTALADPKVSPREAPFHALQSREGTALFELPLPLPGLRGPVELWVERDREGGGGDDRPVRMLLALDLEGMGQVRLGVEGLGGRIHADLWVEEERRAAVAQALGEELGDPPPYPVRVRGFHGPQPGLRHVAGAGPFGALG